MTTYAWPNQYPSSLIRLLTCYSWGNFGLEGGSMLDPGDKAPDFTGRDHTGKTVKLADYKGKTVVLWFYPKADTPG